MRPRRPALGIAFAALFLGAAGPATGEAIRFESETIRVYVRPELVRVEGSYTFVNPSPAGRRQALFYPFPTDSLHPMPTDVKVRIGDEVVSFTEMRRGVLFSVPFPPSGPVTVAVAYEQAALDRTACYILTTTSAWEAPLREAHFEVHVPAGLELVTSSYEFDTVEHTEGGRVHRFSRYDFMPEKDLCLEWR